jgi:hypothetical protein
VTAESRLQLVFFLAAKSMHAGQRSPLRRVFQRLAALKFGFHCLHVEWSETSFGYGFGDSFAEVIVIENWRLGLFDEKVNSVRGGVFYLREAPASVNRGELLWRQRRLIWGVHIFNISSSTPAFPPNRGSTTPLLFEWSIRSMVGLRNVVNCRVWRWQANHNGLA